MSESTVTKKAIADGFKSLMEKKSFEKITISDITSACGLNRQTFYYHFQDKYDLLNWIFDQEIISPLTENYSISTWSDALLNMLVFFKENAKFYTNALNTSYSNEFKDYLFNATAKLFNDILEQLTNGQLLNADDKRFLSEFMSYGVSGSVIKWILTGMKESPQSIVFRLRNLINDSKNVTLTRYIQDAIT